MPPVRFSLTATVLPWTSMRRRQMWSNITAIGACARARHLGRTHLHRLPVADQFQEFPDRAEGDRVPRQGNHALPEPVAPRHPAGAAHGDMARPNTGASLAVKHDDASDGDAAALAF